MIVNTETQTEYPVTASGEILDVNGNVVTLSVLVTDKDTVKTVERGYVDLQVKYYIDGALVDYQLIHRCGAGKSILTLLYTFDSLDGNANFQWQVKILVASGTGTVTVPKRGFRASITGQGMAGTDQWDGTISAEEIWEDRGYTYLGFNASEEIATIFHTPDTSAISESVGNGLAFAYLDFGASEVVEAVPTVTQNTIDPIIDAALMDWVYEDRYVEVGENGVQLKTVWNYESAEQEIDTGRMTAVKAVTNDLASVTGMEVDAE